MKIYGSARLQLFLPPDCLSMCYVSLWTINFWVGPLSLRRWQPRWPPTYWHIRTLSVKYLVRVVAACDDCLIGEVSWTNRRWGVSISIHDKQDWAILQYTLIYQLLFFTLKLFFSNILFFFLCEVVPWWSCANKDYYYYNANKYQNSTTIF